MPWHFIAPDKPMEKGIFEAIRPKIREDLLNETLFFDLSHARSVIAAWLADYNAARIHSARGYNTPATLAAKLVAKSNRLHKIDALRRSPIAPSAKPKSVVRQLWL